MALLVVISVSHGPISNKIFHLNGKKLHYLFIELDNMIFACTNIIVFIFNYRT